MENQPNFDDISYKKAKKRVSEIKNYYWFVIGYLIVAAILLSRDYGHNAFNFSNGYINLMLVLQGIFLAGYGCYLFVPAFNNWEERKIKKLMNQYKNNRNGK